jgi:hypothetical protein
LNKKGERETARLFICFYGKLYERYERINNTMVELFSTSWGGDDP